MRTALTYRPLIPYYGNRLTDGADWVELTGAELDFLERWGAVTRCTGGCVPNTWHPIMTWAAIGDLTARYQRGER